MVAIREKYPDSAWQFVSLDFGGVAFEKVQLHLTQALIMTISIAKHLYKENTHE